MRRSRSWRSRGFYATVAVVALGLLTGCSGDPPARPGPAPQTTPPGGNDRHVESPPLPEKLELPALDDGMTALLQMGPTTGSARVGRTTVTGDVWWISVNCRGGGVLTVQADPVVTFEAACTDPMERTRNQFELDEPYDIEITVQAPDATEWALLVQQ